LTVIGLAVAAGVGSVIAFVPLYAQEELGISAPAAGLLAGVIGITGVAGRVVWGARASRVRYLTVPLTLIAALALFSTLAIWMARAATALIWVGAAGAGFSMVAWHAVAWLALLDAVDLADVGRTSGLVQLGSSTGFATGPPIVGVLVDASGSYGWGWGFVASLFTLALGMTILWGRRLRWPGGQTGRDAQSPSN
jgi:MFS-type transporter involved in bile tolerance (Atg22 family)